MNTTSCSSSTSSYFSSSSSSSSTSLSFSDNTDKISSAAHSFLNALSVVVPSSDLQSSSIKPPTLPLPLYLISSSSSSRLSGLTSAFKPIQNKRKKEDASENDIEEQLEKMTSLYKKAEEDIVELQVQNKKLKIENRERLAEISKTKIIGYVDPKYQEAVKGVMASRFGDFQNEIQKLKTDKIELIKERDELNKINEDLLDGITRAIPQVQYMSEKVVSLEQQVQELQSQLNNSISSHLVRQGNSRGHSLPSQNSFYHSNYTTAPSSSYRQSGSSSYRHSEENSTRLHHLQNYHEELNAALSNYNDARPLRTSGLSSHALSPQMYANTQPVRNSAPSQQSSNLIPMPHYYSSSSLSLLNNQCEGRD